MHPLLLIDGYNVIAPIAAPNRAVDGNWLHRERMSLIRRLSDNLPSKIRDRTCVVFDAANPPRDRPNEFIVDGMEVRFAVGYPEADDLLEAIITQHTVPKKLVVVSSDRRVQTAAKRRGCQVRESQSWFDDLLDGKFSIEPAEPDTAERGRGVVEDKKPDRTIDKGEIDQWMREFGFDD